jgi:drug/metabolite transporter (DMT)-like permease
MLLSFRQSIINKVTPWAFLLVMGIAWGLAFSLGKIAVENGGEPFGIVLYQAFGSGLILLAFTVIRKKPILEMKDKLGFLLVVGLLGLVIPTVLFYYAAEHVQAGILAITVALVPLLTYGFSIPLKMEKFSGVRFMGLVFGVVAICFIALPENSLPDRSALPWILLACISSFSYTAENIILAFRSALVIGPIRLAMGMNLMSALTVLPITLMTDSFYIPNLPPQAIEFAVIGLILITVLAYTMFVMSVALYGPVFASQTGYVVTLAGVFWGILIFDETHSIWIWLALASMIIGLALVTPRGEASSSEDYSDETPEG